MSLPSPFAAFLSQHARLLEITTALPDAALVVERFSGREAVNALFRFEIDCISTSAGLDLLALTGEEITLRLLQADGSKRAWHGYVTEALQLGADGGFARYRLIMEPWLALLRERRDSYVFQDKTVLEILGQLFADHPQANWAHGVTQELRRYSLSLQYRESDLDYCRRLLAEEGLSFRFSHDQNAVAGDEATHARHRLEIFDRETALPELAQPVLRFHRNNATEASDTVQTWQEIRNALPNAVTIAGWDYKTLLATGAEVESTQDNGEVPRMEVHDASLPYRYTDGAAARRHADLRLAAWEAAYRRFAGDSTVRQAAAGQNFTLSQHEEYQGDDARFTLLAVDHDGANNLGAQAAKLLGSTAVEAGSYRNRLHAQPAALPVVPQPLQKPLAPPQVALVVGVSGAPLSTERDHRVKIQFPWQRGEQPNPGGLAADAPGKSGNAPGNEQSGTWVRVTEWLAGPNWGSHFLPRIGTEVIVSFLDGDIDRPVIAGQIHNGADLPPFSAGHEASANHPGVLAGWMSHNFESGHNQWVIDDAPGQLRTRLAASDNASQLALGHLIHQAPESASRGAWRGSGFELRSDGWLAVRAGEGILISATARPNAVSTQMDIAEAVGQMRAAEETAKALSDAARAQQALPLNANTKQSDFITALDPQKDGKFTAPVGGQEAKKAQPGSRDLGDPTERFNEPAIVAEAPGDIALTSPASTLLFAGANLHATIQQDLHLAAAHTLAVTVGEAASWFSHAGGIKSIAEAGSHTIHAHTDQLEILADQSVTVTSSNDEIHILANKQIRLVGGQSSVTLEGSNITFACPGTFSVKGSSNAFIGPGSQKAVMEILPDSRVKIFDEQVQVHNVIDGNPIVGMAYYAETASGDFIHGITDENGKTPRISTQSEEIINIYWGIEAMRKINK